MSSPVCEEALRSLELVVVFVLMRALKEFQTKTLNTCCFEPRVTKSRDSENGRVNSVSCLTRTHQLGLIANRKHG